MMILYSVACFCLKRLADYSVSFAGRRLWGSVPGPTACSPPVLVPQAVAGRQPAGEKRAAACYLGPWLVRGEDQGQLSELALQPHSNAGPSCLQDAQGVWQLMVGDGAPGRGRQLGGTA